MELSRLLGDDNDDDNDDDNNNNNKYVISATLKTARSLRHCQDIQKIYQDLFYLESQR